MRGKGIRRRARRHDELPSGAVPEDGIGAMTPIGVEATPILDQEKGRELHKPPWSWRHRPDQDP